MNLLRILLVAALVLVVFGTGEADADKEPMWTYDVTKFPLFNGLPVSISEDGEYIGISGIEPGTIFGNSYFFERNNSSPIWGPFDLGRSIDMSDDGKHVVVCCSGFFDNVSLLNNYGEFIRNYKLDPSPHFSRSIAKISGDGNYIVAASFTKIHLFDKNNGTELWNFSTGFALGCYDTLCLSPAIDISDNGEYITAALNNANGTLNLFFFTKNSNIPVWSYEVGIWDRPSVAISSDGNYIALGSGNLYFFSKNSSTLCGLQMNPAA